ncbi:RHS repeat-associated core domain-containing protein [Micromonospora sp. HM134]|uniref:RHS repeat-associated core domain-containing protein n=1 Tax=Micromonospora sp. HM134 TaxID=2583243 RepID=UPI00272ECCDA|nr:RHS repeat-associated core domain-containing protein [Micromonospora sp. HM134]
MGDLIRTTAPNGAVTHFGYDYFGRKVRVSDGLGRTTRASYDLFGNLTSDANLNADGDVLRTQRYGYDEAGNMVSSKDPYNVVTTYEYDTANRLVRQIEPVTDTESITTSFGYDAAGNRTRYTDGRGNATIYTFNTLGLPESAIEPATSSHPTTPDRTWTVGYDAEGRATRISAPGETSRQRTYDAAGRLTAETGSGGESTTAARSLGYDKAGRLTSVSAPTGTNTYTYNDRGAVLSTSGPSGAATFGYDDDGQMTTRTDVTGTATFGYVKGRLTSLTDSITEQRQNLTYDAAGEVKTIDYGAGRIRTFGYDDLGRVNSDTLKNAANAVVASVAYGFDLNGHLTSKDTTGTAGAGNNTYTYDKAGRLTGWTSPAGTITYAWDASGNRIRAGSKTATYDARNRLLTDSDYTYTYSPRGTLRSRTSSGLSEQYAFDAFDRLTTAITQTYQYDGLDRVVSRTGTTFTYAGLGDDVVADGVEYFARGPADELLATGQGSDEQLSLTDAHGDVVAAFDPASTSLTTLNDSTSYDPFGKKITSIGDTGNLGFQGDWTDPQTGQVDMGARWYDPGTGAFTSRDSVDYTSGDSILANRYAYAAGAPLDFDDPDGHWPKWLKRAARSVSNGYHAATNFVSSTASWAWNYGTRLWNQGISALRSFGQMLYNGATRLYNKAKTAVENTYRHIKQGVTNLRTNATNWAKEQARAAAQRIYEAKKAVTNAAKAAVRQAIKFTKLPVVAALTKPLLAGVKLVSGGIKVMASVVAVTQQAIRDPDKFRQKLFLEAAQRLAPLVEGANEMWDKATQFVEDHAAEIAGIAVACGALAGAVGSAVTGYMNGKRGWDLAGETALGGLFGAAGGAAGAVGGAALGAGLRALGGGMRAAGGKAVSAGLGEARTIGRGLMGRSGGCLGPGNSFTGDTKVLMADGSHKPIRYVKLGDRVLATDPTTGRTAPRVVTALIVGSGTKQLVDITVTVDGPRGSGRAETITATAGHPFWIADQHQWREAKDLKPGYTFETADHRPAAVAATHHRTQPEVVHNLTVDTLHTYYVVAGTTPVLVHNCGTSYTHVALGLRAHGLRESAEANGHTHFLDDTLEDALANVRDVANSHPGATIHVRMDGFKMSNGRASASPAELFEDAYREGGGDNWFTTQREMNILGRSVRLGNREWESIRFTMDGKSVNFPRPGFLGG